jgi:hypothetical protein
MPVELIPNQPIIFQDPIGQYPCLNNDPRQYAVLMQENDQLCMQWKLTECNPDSMCEPNMVMDPVGSNLLSTWSVTGDWDTTGSSNLSFGWGSGLGGLTYSANQNVTFIAGAVYKLTFDVTIYTGDKQYEVYLSPSAIPQYFNALGSYTLYFIGPPTGGSQSIVFRNQAGTYTAADSILIENLELIQVTDCWLDDFDTNVPSWTYSFDGNNGRFCSRIFTGGDLINTNAFVNTGNYHGVSLTIDDCSYGGLQVFLGGVLLGTTSGNGQFNFYGTPTSGTDLTLVKTGDFDGCVSLVSVKDYGDISSYYVQMYDNDSSNFVNITPVSVYDDRIVLCTTIEDLDWENGVPTCANIEVELTEGCNGQKYNSVNTINWNAAGHECTKVVEAWNDGYAFGFYFGDVAAPDFKLIHRLRVLAFNPVYQNAAEEYLYSSGNRGRSFAQSQKARTAWFDYCDEYAHDVIRLQLLSQKLFIDNYAFFYPVADYEPEWNDRGKYNLAQSRVTVFHEETVFGSTCGTFANAICPPQIVSGITKINMKLIFNGGLIGTTWNSVTYRSYYSDSLGNGTTYTTDTTSRNLNVAGDLTAILNLIQGDFDLTYGGTSIAAASIIGTTLNISLEKNFTGAFPQPLIIPSIVVSASYHIPVFTYFS